jgi:subtilisin family serine protease
VSPDYPPGAAVVREVGNERVVAPAALTGVVAVSATGPIGYPIYELWIADYSSVGMSRVYVTAPGGDYFQATGTVQDAVTAAVPTDGSIWAGLDPLSAVFPGLTTVQGGAGYVYLNGTSMSSPHAAGVAALIVKRHPNWAPDAVEAALQRTSQAVDCPPEWGPLNAADERERCYGQGAKTSFVGHGLVDALEAATS